MDTKAAASVEQIGVAADDLAVTEHNDAATLADAPVLQADVNRIQSVFHLVPVPAAVAQRLPVFLLCQTAKASATRQVDFACDA